MNSSAPTPLHPPSTSPLQTLHPAYFAMVMATGIVSIAAQLLEFTPIAWSLFVINIIAYLTLWLLFAARAIHYGAAMCADFSNHARGVGFFTMIAGTCVLGSQFVVVAKLPAVALWLWCLGTVLWVVLIYGIFTLLTVRPTKPDLTEGLNGGWIVAVVAPQSVSILGSQLVGGFPNTLHDPVLFFCLIMWLCGGMLYVWLISLIFYRYTFLKMQPADLAPPYWINMGAVAISTLAGTFLVGNRALSPLVADLMPFIKGVTLAFWATATWWIPMLVTLGVWRHVYHRFPLKYDPLYWGAVFPLGMYTVCTFRLAEVIDAPFLRFISRYFVYIAFAAWGLTFWGLLTHLFRGAQAGLRGRTP